MSTYLGAKKANRLLSLDDLPRYFETHAKPASRHLIGLEWELFGVAPATGEALPYQGPAGIEAALKALAEHFGYERLEESGQVIGLVRGERFVSLEPGGQLELSAEPVKTVHDVKQQLDAFRDELKEIAGLLGITWITFGFHPFSAREVIEWVPKRRYDIMREYFRATGSMAHDMMKRTAANQVSIDYLNERDAMEKLRVIHGVSSLVSAVFAHSSISEGAWNGCQTRRMAAWRETDSERCGLIERLLREEATFADYVDYVLDTPMLFVIRGDRWLPMEGLRFREFLLKGRGELRATLDDLELHLSTIFPEARLKNCIEIRGADGQRFPLIPSVAALWKGLLYDHQAREGAWDLVKGFSWEERMSFHLAIEKSGPEAHLGNFRGWDLARELCAIAVGGLRRQSLRNERGEDESVYLEPILSEVIGPESTPAEKARELWEGDFHRKSAALLAYLGL